LQGLSRLSPDIAAKTEKFVQRILGKHWRLLPGKREMPGCFKSREINDEIA